RACECKSPISVRPDGPEAGRMKDLRVRHRTPLRVDDSPRERHPFPKCRLPEVLRVGRIPASRDRAVHHARTDEMEPHDLPGLPRGDVEAEAPLALRVRDGRRNGLRPRLAPRLAAGLVKGGFVRHGRYRDPGGGPGVEREPTRPPAPPGRAPRTP